MTGYFEPWAAERSRSWRPPWPAHPAGLPAEVYEEITSKCAKLEADADWLLWGTGVAEPAVVTSLEGTLGATSGRGIVASVSKIPANDRDAPTHEAVARRICACVNALAGVAEPERALAEVRAFLLGLLAGTTAPDEAALVRLVALIHPQAC
jgi:hypothetical protein